MVEGEFALVRQHLEKALHKGFSEIGEHDVYAMLLDTAVMQRDETSLRIYAPLLEGEATQLDHSLYLAIAHRGWGVLHFLTGEFAKASARLDQAIVMFSDLETRWQLGRTHFELGELAVARSSMDEAREQYSTALNLFEEMGASPDAARALSALESSQEHNSNALE